MTRAAGRLPDSVSLFLFFLAASIVNVAPIVIDHVGGDILFQLMSLKCFAEQFWQGNLRPIWCMSGHNGLGAPIFLFYFPLPLWLASLSYPMTWAGIDLYFCYALSCFAATLTAAYTAYLLLREWVSRRNARLFAALYLFLPYRMALLVNMAAHSECWAVAELPLLFYFARKLALKQTGFLGYSITLGLLCLTHMVSAAIGGAFSLLYIFLLTPSFLKAAMRALPALAFAASLAAFYLAPAWHYHHYIVGEQVFSGTRTWANDFLNVSDGASHPRLVIDIGITVALFVFFAIKTFRIARQMDGVFFRESLIMIGLATFSLFLLLPASRFLYQLTRPLSDIVLPWRMQEILMLGLFYCLAVSHDKARLIKSKSGIMDYVLLLVFFFFLGQFLFNGLAEGDRVKTFVSTLLAKDAVVPAEYRPLWVDKEHYSADASVPNEKPPLLVQTVSGTGTIDVTQWNWQRLAFTVHSSDGITLRLRQRYFPTWKATANGSPLPISPEPASGQMLLAVSPGDNRVEITNAIAHDEPVPMALSEILSLLAWIAAGVALWQRKWRTNLEVN